MGGGELLSSLVRLQMNGEDEDLAAGVSVEGGISMWSRASHRGAVGSWFADVPLSHQGLNCCSSHSHSNPPPPSPQGQ